MDICEELDWRASVQQTTDPDHLPQWLAAASRTLYAGFDPTSDGLHVGNFVALMMLRRFQKAGHRPIVLAGGATGMIGDPSGKNQERTLLSPEIIDHNLQSISGELQQFLDFESSNGAILVNNYDWMKRWDYLSFLRDIGKHFPVNVMLAKESVKTRLEQTDAGMSYTEFSYMLLQAYDFVHLHKEFGCELQVGGSDQWGNITAGIELGRRLGTSPLYGITCPLLTRSDGAKMGKTEQGTIWLSPQKTSPYAFYQYWYNVDDDVVGNCLRLLTEMEQEDILALDEDRQVDPGSRNSQRRLAETITEFVHGKDGLSKACRASEVLFGAEVSALSDQELAEIFSDVPSETVDRGELSGEGLDILEAFCRAGLAKSKSEARRCISQGGAYVNNHRVEDVEARLSTNDLASESVMVLRSGKKRYALLMFP